MTDIPEDVMKTAELIADDIRGMLPHARPYIIARAIMAERERCAGLAMSESERREEKMLRHNDAYDKGASAGARMIAAAIVKGWTP